MSRPIGDRIATQADKLRQAIRYIEQAKDLIPQTILVATAEAGMDYIDDDFASILGKLKPALATIDALLDEMEEVT